MAATIPANIRAAVLQELAKQFDGLRWEEIAATEATEMYNRFVKDPKIGGRLAPFMALEKIRVWIKDGPAKEYRRGLEGVGSLAPYTERAYPGPESVVRQALGDHWSVRPGTIREKPMRCFAADAGRQSMFVIWGPLSGLQGLVWNSCLVRADDPLEPITIVITKPSSAPLRKEDWKQVQALADIVDADCKQVTYTVGRKQRSGVTPKMDVAF